MDCIVHEVVKSWTRLSLSLSYFYCYYISSTSDCQALDLGGWGPLVIEGSIQGQMTNNKYTRIRAGSGQHNSIEENDVGFN